MLYHSSWKLFQEALVGRDSRRGIGDGYGFGSKSCSTPAGKFPLLGEGEWVVGQVLPREVAIGVRLKPLGQASIIFSVIVHKPFALIKFELVDP